MQASGRLKRCVFAAAEFANDEVADFRRRYDALFGKCPPHVTLAFPFVSDVATDQIARALEASLPPGSLEITLLPPQFERGYVMLPLERPDPWFASSYLRLSRLIGARALEAYRPHVTIGRGLTTAPVAAMATLPARQHARIDRVVLEEIQEDESSRVLHEVALR